MKQNLLPVARLIIVLHISILHVCNCQLSTLFSTVKRTPTPRACVEFLQEGITKDGYYSLYDFADRRYTAYCDFTSDPGSAWTLITSFSRHAVRNEQSQVLKRKSLGDQGAVNEDSPNWDAFRSTKQRIEALHQVSSHFRMTCSEEGPFIGIKNFNDFVRVNLSSFDPLKLDVPHEQCVATEYISVRNISCSDCKVSFSQRRGAWSLHIDAWLAQNKCGMERINDEAVHSEDLFGFYDQYNTKFSCTKYPWSTTQIWLGSRLSNENIHHNLS